MIDLPKYFERLDIAPLDEPTPESLRAIVMAHATRIPFENLDAWRGRAVSLEPAAVERKLVGERRGGWCFEQNLLLGEALRQIGYDVTDYAARVLWGRPITSMPARTHRLLGVRLPSGLHFVDVGFGGMTVTAPLRHVLDEEQPTPHARFVLRDSDDDLLLLVQGRDDWTPMYRFDLHPQRPVDFEAANFQLVHDPASHFRQSLIAARATPDGRVTLRDREFTQYTRDGGVMRRQLADEAEVRGILRSQFFIETRDVEGFGKRFAASFSAP